MINVLAQLGNVISPYFFRDQDEPRYVLAMCLLIGFSAISGFASLFLKWNLTRANKRIEQESAENGTTPRFFST